MDIAQENVPTQTGWGRIKDFFKTLKGSVYQVQNLEPHVAKVETPIIPTVTSAKKQPAKSTPKQNTTKVQGVATTTPTSQAPQKRKRGRPRKNVVATPVKTNQKKAS